MDNSQKQELNLPRSQEVGVSSANTPTARELERLLEVASAYKTVRKDCISSDQGHGETLSDVLRRDLNRRFSSIDLVPDQTRASVIARTQPRSVITSTPTNSPPPAIPPRTCQSLGPIQIVPPHPTSCSPTCSELSSINGEVFIESDYSEVSRLHPSLAAPGTTLNPQVTIVTKTMEAAKAEISKKNKKLMFKMNNFEPEDIDSETIDDYRDKLLGIETLQKQLNSSPQIILMR